MYKIENVFHQNLILLIIVINKIQIPSSKKREVQCLFKINILDKLAGSIYIGRLTYIYLRAYCYKS